MNKFLDFDPVATKACFRGIYKRAPKAERCMHVFCGYNHLSGFVPCVHTRYTRHTDQELATPNPNLEMLAGIYVDVAHKGEIRGMSFLYDLQNDKLIDEWMQGDDLDLSPHTGRGLTWPRPSMLVNYYGIIKGMKVAL